MRNKTTHALIEQLFMSLVLVIAAVICVKAFALSHAMVVATRERDRAALLCQSAAELVEHYGGDVPSALSTLTGHGWDRPWPDWNVYYDDGWHETDKGGDPRYMLQVNPYPGQDYDPCLGSALITVSDCSDPDVPVLVEMKAAWQKEYTHE